MHLSRECFTTLVKGRQSLGLSIVWKLLMCYLFVCYCQYKTFTFFLLLSYTDGLIGLGVLGGAAAVGGALAVGAVALVGLAIAKAKQ